VLATLDHESDCFDESHRIAIVHGVIQDYFTAMKHENDPMNHSAAAIRALDVSINPSFFLYHSLRYMLDLPQESDMGQGLYFHESHMDILLYVAFLVLRGVFEAVYLEIASKMILKDLKERSVVVPIASKTVAHFFVNCVERGLLPWT
jgi:hypothetical protein